MSNGLTSAVEKMQCATKKRATRDYRHVTLTEHECASVLTQLAAEREAGAIMATALTSERELRERAEAELAAARAERDRWKQTTRDAIHQGGDLLGRAERAEAEAARLQSELIRERLAYKRLRECWDELSAHVQKEVDAIHGIKEHEIPQRVALQEGGR